MAITFQRVTGAHSQDLLYLPVSTSRPLGANVANVSYLGQRWIRSDLKTNNNNGLFPATLAGSSSADVAVSTFRFAFDVAPTQRAQVGFNYDNPAAASRRLYLNTSRKLELYDGTTYHEATTALATGTEYEIAVVNDFTNTTTRELIYVNKVVDLDKTLTRGIGLHPIISFGESLGASNPGCYLYIRDMAVYRLASLSETMYQIAVGYAVARADGTLNQWTKSDGGLNYWDHVDEIPAASADYLQTNAPSTPKTAQEYLTQRAGIGPATSDTILAVSAGWYAGAVWNSGTKWTVGGGIRQGTNEAWGTDIPSPGSGAWAGTPDQVVYNTKPGGGAWAASDLDDVQIGIRIPTGASHNIYTRWGAGIAFVGYYNSSMALATPPTGQRRPLGAFV